MLARASRSARCDARPGCDPGYRFARCRLRVPRSRHALPHRSARCFRTSALARDGRTSRINRRGGSEPQRSPATISPSRMLPNPALSLRRSRRFFTPNSPLVNRAYGDPGGRSRTISVPDKAYRVMGNCSALCVTPNPLESLNVFLRCSRCMLQSTVRNARALRPGTKKHGDAARGWVGQWTGK